jgi:short-subunit dehydrogenase
MDQNGEGRTALITGASSGIGLAFAEEFARHGFSLVLTARRTARLEAIAADLTARFGARVGTIPADLSDPEAPARIFEEIERAGLGIDALVNNAGYGVSGHFHDAPWDAHGDFLEVLVRAPCALSYLALPAMRARKFGRIINIASLAGFLPASLGSTLYPAAKGFLIAFSQSLALELKDTGIHVTAVCPGLTYTEFHDKDELRADIARAPRWVWMNAETVARQGYDAVMRGTPLIVNGAHNAVAAALLKRLPNRVALGLIRSTMKA